MFKVFIGLAIASIVLGLVFAVLGLWGVFTLTVTGKLFFTALLAALIFDLAALPFI